MKAIVAIIFALCLTMVKCQVGRLCKERLSRGVKIPKELRNAFFKGQNYACVSFYHLGDSFKTIIDEKTEQLCQIKDAFNAKNSRNENMSGAMVRFLKALSAISIEQNLPPDASIVLIPDRLFVTNGVMYCKVEISGYTIFAAKFEQPFMSVFNLTNPPTEDPPTEDYQTSEDYQPAQNPAELPPQDDLTSQDNEPVDNLAELPTRDDLKSQEDKSAQNIIELTTQEDQLANDPAELTTPSIPPTLEAVTSAKTDIVDQQALRMASINEQTSVKFSMKREAVADTNTAKPMLSITITNPPPNIAMTVLNDALDENTTTVGVVKTVTTDQDANQHLRTHIKITGIETVPDDHGKKDDDNGSATHGLSWALLLAIGSASIAGLVLVLFVLCVLCKRTGGGGGTLPQYYYSSVNTK